MNARPHHPLGRLAVLGLALAPVLASGLAGCSWFGEDKPPPPCPTVSVLGDAAQLVRYSPGPGRDITDIGLEVRMGDARSGCEYRMNDADEPTGVTVQAAAVTAFNRGAANRDRQAAVTYFVALVGPDDAIVRKSEFPIQVAFPGNRTSLVHIESDPPVTLDIPLPTLEGEDR